MYRSDFVETVKSKSGISLAGTENLSNNLVKITSASLTSFPVSGLVKGTCTYEIEVLLIVISSLFSNLSWPSDLQ